MISQENSLELLHSNGFTFVDTKNLWGHQVFITNYFISPCKTLILDGFIFKDMPIPVEIIVDLNQRVFFGIKNPVVHYFIDFYEPGLFKQGFADSEKYISIEKRKNRITILESELDSICYFKGAQSVEYNGPNSFIWDTGVSNNYLGNSIMHFSSILHEYIPYNKLFPYQLCLPFRSSIERNWISLQFVLADQCDYPNPAYLWNKYQR